MKGILYAPNGNVNINSSSFKFEGKIIAKNIIYRGSLLEIKDYVDTISKDEDNDGDGAEIKNNLNPLEKDTNKNGVIDSEEIIKCYFVIDEEDYYYDIDVLQSNSKVDHGKADVVFTIDTTGSMWGPIGNVKQNINVVTNSASKSSYERLYSETNGIIANIDGDFVTVLEPLIQRMSDISGEGTWIRLANGSIVKLDKDPSLGDMTVDTDRDGVPDLLELRDEIKKTYYSSGELKSYKCWTTISNPVMKDTDGDGIGDNSDIYPSRFDINVVDENNEYIKLNTGKTWTKFCEEI
ncbi:MAG: hypothetical protein ACLR3R_06585 [Clostridium paraputrificum]